MTVIEKKPDMSHGIWAEDGNVEAPSEGKVKEGWVVEKPLNEYMNWIMNRQDRMLQYLNQQGIAGWDENTTYPINAFVSRDGIVYKSLSQNFDKDPTLHSNIWQIAFSTYQDVDGIKSEVDKIKTNDGYLTKYVQKSTPILDGVSKGVGYAGQDLSRGVFFNSNQNAVIRSGSGIEYNFNGTKEQDNDVIRRSDLRAILEAYTRYNIGDLYVTTNIDNPSKILGYGTWQRFAEGRTLVGLSEQSTDAPTWTKIMKNTYGENEHRLTVQELPTFRAETQMSRAGTVSSDGDWTYLGGIGGHANDNVQDSWGIMKSYPIGGNQWHNNVQPSTVVAIWIRVA